MTTLLAIDDDPASLALIEAVLAREGLEIILTTNPHEGLQIVRQRRPAIVLLDVVMPEMNGLDVLDWIVNMDPTVEVVLLTGHASTQWAVDAIQRGAADYLPKPLDVDALGERIDRLLCEAARRERTLALDRELLNSFQFQGMVGRSPAMLDAFARIRRVAPHFRTVLLTGPTGSGKELAARALHQLSPASTGRFVTCNCSAIVDTLVESELFGHVAGAFTGATRDKAGLFEYANRGSLFLDEIGELPLATQAKLLRVLQEQEIQPVGSPAVRKVDVHLVAATHQDLRAMVAAKQFREDLYYRLTAIEVRLPRLAERKEDLPLLQRYFVEKHAKQYNKPIRGLTRRAQAVLNRYSWPGNVRELENVISSACMLAAGDVLDVLDLPDRLHLPPPPDADEDLLISLDEAQRRHVLKVVDALGGNKVQAAQVLGVSRATLYRLLRSP